MFREDIIVFDHFSYLIFVDMYRERHGEEWPKEWSYRADCASRSSAHKQQIYATGQEAFARAVASQLQGLTSFSLSRKSCKAVTPCIKSYGEYSEQIALPNDNELAELEMLIREQMESKKDKRYI